MANDLSSPQLLIMGSAVLISRYSPQSFECRAATSGRLAAGTVLDGYGSARSPGRLTRADQKRPILSTPDNKLAR
jgi:hypothetical protein